jgi:ornithine cyclodeaminase
MHFNGVGGDCPGKTELHADVLRAASVFVEYEPQTRIEGEIQQLDAGHPVTELREVVGGRKPGRRSPHEITLFDSVGFALEDFSVLRLLQDLARKTGAGEEIDLHAAPEDPRNLFALIGAHSGEDRRCA